MNNADESPQEAKRLPLWKSFVEDNEGTFTFGAFFSKESMEAALGCKSDSMEFAFEVSKVRKALRRKGLNFTSRGNSGEGYSIGMPDTNAAEMKRMQKAAFRAMREGVILGTNTPLDTLSADDRRRHESVLEKMAIRLSLINRRNPVDASLKKLK